MKKTILAAAFVAMTTSPLAFADKYVIDTKGAHASIQFKIKHLGYSWLTGRFNKFSGEFNLEKDIEKSSIVVDIDTTSIDSNHAERDKHLKNADFLEVKKYPKSSFKSTKIVDKGNGKLKVIGDFMLHGVTKSIEIDAEKIGEGKDPWGGYRAGFSGTTSIALKDYNISYNLGPASTHVDLTLHIEGIKK
ncbi:YceI family protein [Algicola sagamiensis]|uniref:YceI family protein n=1 Tax=Algicola sagamiensis TaxID=163869 RepID=UPI00036EF963|nr:YceI family protein [Algicola sagamiensis]